VFGAEPEQKVRRVYTLRGINTQNPQCDNHHRYFGPVLFFTVYLSGQKALSVIKTCRGGGVLNAYGRVGAPSILMRFWRRVDAEEGECAMEVVF